MNGSMMNKMRALPMFPFIPVVPIVVIATVVGLSILNYRAVKRVEEKINQIYPSRSS